MRHRRPAQFITLAALVFLGPACSDPDKLVARAVEAELETDPFHKVHFPPGEALPIDGVWVDAWGGSLRIERGRAFDDTIVPYAGKNPLVYWRQITQAAPGRYRARGSGWMTEPNEPISLSVVSEKKIIVRLGIGDRVYTCQSLTDPARFAADFRAAKNNSNESHIRDLSRDNNGAGTPSVDILRVATNPSALVAPGSRFDLVVDYRIGGGQGDAGPALFEYAILRGDKRLMTSQPVQLEVRPGESASRVVDLKATRDEGLYTLRATVQYAGQSVSAEGSLLIGSRDLLVTELAGEWLCRVGTKTGGLLVLKYVGDALEGSYVFDEAKAQHWDLVSSSIALTGNQLIIRTHEVSESVGGWYKTETAYEIGSDFDELTGISKITDGNWCVRIGETFNVTLVRVPP